LACARARSPYASGRLSIQKGHDILLAAWPDVLRRVPDATLALIGDGPLRAKIETQSPPGVVLAGPVADPRPWYAAADVVVLPSRWEAGVPLVALEAMACGRAVVITAVADIPSALAGAPATAIPPERPAAVAEAVIRRLEHTEQADADGAASRECVEGALRPPRVDHGRRGGGRRGRARRALMRCLKAYA
jgi:glycosyltransferase involved in cell wall biosynthesis